MFHNNDQELTPEQIRREHEREITSWYNIVTDRQKSWYLRTNTRSKSHHSSKESRVEGSRLEESNDTGTNVVDVKPVQKKNNSCCVIS
jgi:hypothetical protein